MRSRALLLAVATVAWHSSSAQVGSSVTPAQRDGITDTVRKATTDLFAAMQTIDADKVATFVTSSPAFAYVGEDGSIIRTPQAWSQSTKDGWSDLQSMQIRVSDSQVAVPSPYVAIETVSLGGTIVPKSGKPYTIDKAALTIVWVREPAGWKMFSFHQSYQLPKT